MMPGVAKLFQRALRPGGVSPKDTLQGKKHSRLLTFLLSLLTLLAFTHFILVTHLPPRLSDEQACQQLLRRTDYTKQIVWRPQSQEMEAVQFIENLAGGQITALLQVIEKGQPHRLDVYVFGCTRRPTSSPSLTLLFKQHGLVEGTVNVTKAHTLSIGQLDTALPQNREVPLQPRQQYLYREYAWRNNAFIQTSFPALYPVHTRGEAEELQELANVGQPLTWRDPLATVEQMTKYILQRSPQTMKMTLLDTNDTITHVSLFQEKPRLEILVTLQRLIQPGNTGLWFVTDVRTPGINLDALPLPAGSPLILRGSTQLATGQYTFTLFDHTLTPLELAKPPLMRIDETGNYSATLFLRDTRLEQPGLLLIEQQPLPESHEAGQILLSSIILS
jgi:hypothetical protein